MVLSGKMAKVEMSTSDIQQVTPQYKALKDTIMRQKEEIRMLKSHLEQVTKQFNELREKHRSVDDVVILTNV